MTSHVHKITDVPVFYMALGPLDMRKSITWATGRVGPENLNSFEPISGFPFFWFFRKHLEKQQKKLAQKGIQVDVDTLRREYLVQRGLLSPEEAGGDSNLGHR